MFTESFLEVEAHYERRLLTELDEIAAVIPHERIAIQWDVAYEFAILEGVMSCAFADPEAEILDRLVRIANRVPPSMELGYHFCYGDSGIAISRSRGHMEARATCQQIAVRLERPLN